MLILYVGQSASGRGFCPVTSIAPCQVTVLWCPIFTVLSPTLYNLYDLRRGYAPHTSPRCRCFVFCEWRCWSVFLCLVRQRKWSFFRRL